MIRRFAGAMLAVTVLLGGCAVPLQKPVDLPSDYFAAKARSGRIGVVMAELPKPDTQFPGAGCLLCIAVASGVHSTLTTQVRTLGVDELKPLPAHIVELLKKRGMDAVLIDAPVNVRDLPDFKAADPLNKSRKDFSALKAAHKLDRLLVVDLTALGIWRSYSAYVPTALPRAVVNGSAYLVDLNTHTLEWHLPIDVSRGAEGNWDEPPKFPGLTNAYFQALEEAMDQIKKPFAQ